MDRSSSREIFFFRGGELGLVGTSTRGWVPSSGLQTKDDALQIRAVTSTLHFRFERVV